MKKSEELSPQDNDFLDEEVALSKYAEKIKLLREKKAEISDADPKADDVLSLLQTSEDFLELIPSLIAAREDRRVENIRDEVGDIERYVAELILNFDLDGKSPDELKKFLQIAQKINGNPSIRTFQSRMLKAIEILEKQSKGQEIYEDIVKAGESA